MLFRSNIQDDTRTVVCGGRILKPFAEVTPDYYLHWFYGTLREPDASKDNIEKPFLSNNFLIHRSVFESVCFEEKLKKYGHEDTLFGFQLTRQNFKIKYINNPVTHEGLDSNDQFIEKTTKSVANLYFLTKEFLLKEECSKIKLLNAASQIESCGLTHLIAKLHSFSGPVLLKQLKSKKPRLILLDLYKLGLFCSIIVSDRK